MGQKHSGHYCQDICHELDKHGCDCDKVDVEGDKPQRLVFDKNLWWWVAIIVVILLVVLLLSDKRQMGRRWSL